MGTFRFLANGLMYCDSAFSTMDCFSKIDQEDQQIYRVLCHLHSTENLNCAYRWWPLAVTHKWLPTLMLLACDTLRERGRSESPALGSGEVWTRGSAKLTSKSESHCHPGPFQAALKPVGGHCLGGNTPGEGLPESNKGMLCKLSANHAPLVEQFILHQRRVIYKCIKQHS